VRLKIPLADPACQYRELKGAVDAAVQQCLESGAYILGQETEAFEAEFAAFLGAGQTVGVASGTDALTLSLKALGIGPGDEVITTPFTYFATAQSILAAGARPVFCDIEEETMGLDPSQIESRVTSRTRAILPVHLYGRLCRIGEIGKIARRQGLALVEDACQAAGAGRGGKRAGTFGDCGCFSFFPTKNLSCAGDGGAVCTDDPETALRLKALRAQGSGAAGRTVWERDGKSFSPPKDAAEKYIHYLLGTNSRLDALQAAILRQKLPCLPRWNRERRSMAGRYAAGLAGTGLELPPMPEGEEAVFHLYTVRCRDRGQITALLRKREIGYGIYYPLPLHLQPALAFLGYREGDFPKAERASRQVLSLPLYPGLGPEAQNTVIEAVKAAVR